MDSRSLLVQRVKENGFSLNSVQIDQVLLYMDLVHEWNKQFNITAHRLVEDLIDKDIVDCLYLNRAIKISVQQIMSLLDMGAGAGFIGIMMSILENKLLIGFLESNRKKINFIRHACRVLGLSSVEFLNIRSESNPVAEKEKLQLACSRATWKPEDFVQNAHYYVQNNGHLFLMCGAIQGNKKNVPKEILANKGLEEGSEFNYQILPKKYQREIFFYTKNISRETK